MKEQDDKEIISGEFADASEAPVTAPAAEGKKGKERKKSAPWKRILFWTITALVIVLIAVAVLFVVHVRRADKSFLFGRAVYRVASESMEPYIMTGDVILVEEVTDPSSLKVGDVITFRAKEGAFKNLAAGTPVTHRIVKIEGDVITTQGDNRNVAPVADQPISFADIIGKYDRTSVPLTKISALLFSRYGFIIVVFIPLMVLLAVQIVNFVRACRMDKEGKSPEEKSVEEVKEQAVKEKEEEIKRKAIEEYLASRKRIEKLGRGRSNKSGEEK